MTAKYRLPAHRRLGRWLAEWSKSLLIALGIWLVLRTFVIESFRIDSESMQNTLLVDDFEERRHVGFSDLIWRAHPCSWKVPT